MGMAGGVAVVGGGLVGSLSACFFAQKGYQVDLYEYREDIRVSQHVRGRSINLALSSRGRAALRAVGLEQTLVRDHGIPMRARMIHSLQGDMHPIPYDPQNKQCIYSVGRRYLNEVLLSATEKYSNVRLHFCHKLVNADLNKGKLVFQTSDGINVECTASLVVGADGAFSTVRRHMLKQPLFDFSQKYIEHGYLELCIPPTPEGKFAMPENYLHIWPRGTFMMIALPNQDRSWTVTLFMPFAQFSSLDSAEALLNFFGKHFPDAIPLLGREKLVRDYLANSPSPLVSVKCSPYHVGSTAVILGDAAHAMVPFYGQGMNAGFEDCLLLDELLTNHELSVALQEFSRLRCPDAHAIVDLAMYNYIEMRDLVNRRSFLIRKSLDSFLYKLMPKIWVPLYSSVTFSNMRYHKCIENKKWQDKIIFRAASLITITAVAGLITAIYQGWGEFEIMKYELISNPLWFLV